MNISWTKAHDCFLLDKIGDSYSVKDAIKGYFGILKADDDRWQCAELANVFYRHIGLDFGNAYTPAKLVQSVLDEGYGLVSVKHDHER
jgi:hypothetical protein